jgi:hypothetical protein
MASQTEPVTTTDVLNYAGPLLYVGATYGKGRTISRAGLNGGWQTVTGNQFPMVNYIAGDANAQDGQTEDASIAAMTNTSYTPTQTTQYMQIFRKTYVVSYAAAALQGNISGVANIDDPQTVARSLPVQRLAHMKQMIGDFNYSALRGASQAWTNAATAGKMGGVVTAVEAGSETAAAGAALSKTLIETEIERMAAAGAEFGDMEILAGAHQMNALNALYGNAITSVSEGGTNVSRLTLPVLGTARIEYEPDLATDDLVFLDQNHFQVVFGMVPGKPEVVVEPIAKLGAGEYEQIFMLGSINYDDIQFHGMVSGLAT